MSRSDSAPAPEIKLDGRMTQPAHSPTLASLITALRQAGIAVGITDIERLRRVFALEPPGDRLASILRAVLVKTDTDRTRFERVHAAWVASAERTERRIAAMQAGGPAVRLLGFEMDDDIPRPARASARSRPLAIALGILAPIALYLVALALIWPGQPENPDKPETLAVRSRVPTSSGDGQPKTSQTPSACAPSALRDPKYTFQAPVPVLTATGGEARWIGWWPLALGLFGLFAAGIGWLQLRTRQTIPARHPPTTGAGPSRAHLAPALLRGPALLDARQQETMVWGIGRFVSEQTTRHLDIAATVRDTARNGGIPHIHFHRARYHREVWLWVDEQADDPTIARLAREVAETLRANGLPVEQMIFRGVPDRLRVIHTGRHAGHGHGLGHGQEYTPAELYERRHSATVVVLTDARVFLSRYRSHHKRRLDSLLRELSHWPRLALVDCSPGGADSAAPDDLALIAATHDIDVIQPGALASFLGSSSTRHTRPDSPGERDAWGLTLWAAACAISPGPVAEITAEALRRTLDLPISPLALAALRVNTSGAASPTGRLTWSESRRVDHLRWLREAQEPELGVLGTSVETSRTISWLDQAIAFWRRQYRTDDQRRLDGDPGWKERPARRQREIEMALLDLWRDPVTAAQALHDRWNEQTEAMIRQHLGHFAPADSQDVARIRTLWTAEQCPPVELTMLQAMGFHGGLEVDSLRKPGRLWLGVSWVAGLSVGAFAFAAMLWTEPPAEPVVAELGRADAWSQVVQEGDGWRVSVATPQSQASLFVVPGARVLVDWKERETACVSRLANGELWRCGAGFQRPPGRDEPGRRVVVIFGVEDSIYELALGLLDCGEADLVYIDDGENWPTDRREVFGEMMDRESVTTIEAGGIDAELGRLHQELACGSGVMFSEIPGGTFWMGTRDDDGDSGSYDEEKPAHEVTLSPYALARCEVSNRQYQSFLEATGRDEPPYWRDEQYNQASQPVVGVSWHDADAYCQHFGYSLPTEAQWEYACRGGDRRGAWPGVEGGESALKEYAWYSDEIAEGATHPVGTRRATAFGLYDMHGNAWEWVRDWYGQYSNETVSDPEGPSESDAPEVDTFDENGRAVKVRAKLLRGGSFFSGAGNLRCANRFGGLPASRDWFFGFRCVRGGRRQP